MSITKKNFMIITLTILAINLGILLNSKFAQNSSKNFIIKNGQKKTLQEKTNNLMQSQVNSIKNTQQYQQNNTTSSIKSNIKTINNVQKINKFNKK